MLLRRRKAPVYRALLGAAAVLAGVTFFLPSPLLAGRGAAAGRDVSIRAVYGMVDGACSAARARELERAISGLTTRDLAWKHHCRCGVETAESIKNMYRLSEGDGTHVVRRPPAHLVHIVLSHPDKLPYEGKVPLLDRGTTDVIARVQAFHGFPVRTDLWLGQFDRRRQAVIYMAFILPGDPFHLAQSECKPAGGYVFVVRS